MRFSLELIQTQLPRIRAMAMVDVLPLAVECAPGPLAALGPDAPWRRLHVGERWGDVGETWLLRAPFNVPDHWTQGHIRLSVNLSEYGDLTGPEALALLDGNPVYGIDRYHQELPLEGLVRPGEAHDLVLEVYSSLLAQPHTLLGCELQLIDPDVDALYHDVRVVHDALLTMSDNSLDRISLMHALERSYNVLNLLWPGSPDFHRSVSEARSILHGSVFERDDHEPLPRTVAVGHAHIDLAWLWPVAQTRRKGARTFSTALRLMDIYPEYHFVASQPALYEMVREDEPSVYESIRRRVREGRWEPTGASWVEMDCNLTGSESLVRQFLVGKRHFREELGVDPTILWLPDVFGYSAALPQVTQGCEVEYFMTTKISWNEYNRFPYDTFLWRGIDGTEVLTHMVTAPILPEERSSRSTQHAYYTYNAKFTPFDVAGNWDAYRQKAVNDELLYLFGYGDGGGGPTPEMQETALRLRGLPGFPHVQQSSAQEFFRRLHERVRDNPNLPRWVGELYLEYHRGTYTSQGWIKRANRKAEVLYHEAELWASIAQLGDDARTKLLPGWKSLLFHQFHDILPGSSIHQVYEDARHAYTEIDALGVEVRDKALDALVEPGQDVIVFNPAPFERADPVEVVGSAALEILQLANDKPDVWDSDIAQPLEDVDGRHRVLVEGFSPGLGAAPWQPHRHRVRHGLYRPPPPPFQIGEHRLENEFYVIELDEYGHISSVHDKRVGREVIESGSTANRLIAFEDRPLNFDAWDIQIDYQDKAYPVDDLQSLRVVETGPLRGGIEIVRRFGQSNIRQQMLIYRDVPRIDFVTHVDWHEHQTLLKAAFPVAVHSARATFDIQWGNVERPTHWNTSWDWARFETCAHKWVDLSEGDYGVSLLNDCKYGHDIKDNTIRLTLIKSGIYPDPEADQGQHVFTYSLLPHPGDWRQGETVKHAYLLNMPQSVRIGSLDGPPKSFITTTRPGLVIETVKPAEDGDGIIVRCFDAYNSRGPASLVFARSIRSADETNMLERKTGDVQVEGRTLYFDVRPYGINTFRVRLG